MYWKKPTKGSVMPSARTVRSATAVLGGAAVLAVAPAAPASAHEKYFLRDGYA
ncbi:MAG: hypothetical protein QOC60_715, partial [Frankiaceae bacterium]|nr:hypothetical protein [Frankiaceae bacterium]